MPIAGWGFAPALAAGLGLEVHAGHGLDFSTAEEIATLGEIAELNIGHFLIGEAIFEGLDPAVRRMRAASAGVSASSQSPAWARNRGRDR